MKSKYIFFTLLFILISSSIFAQGWFINNTFSPAQSLQAIRFYDANTGYTTAPVYGGSMLEIHKTTNGGQNWIDQNAGYTGERFMAIWIVHPDTVYISGNDGHILKTVNGGNNWVTLTSGDTVQLWGLQFVNSFTGYAAGSYGHIIKTTNAGASWVQQTAVVQNLFSSVCFRNENTGYISGSVIVIKTTNGGTNWVNLNVSMQSGEGMNQIQFIDDQTGYGITSASRFFKTTNAGASWSSGTIGPSQSLMAEYFIDANTGFACGWNGTILNTTDAGASWSTQVSGITDILTGVWFTSPNTGYISTWFGHVLKTTNGGVTFIEPISNEIPNNFSLKQNYPNPFNPTTSIEFQVPNSVGTGRDLSVKIIIYDAAGNEITTLVNEPLHPGAYRTTWNASSYASGVYFYKLVAGDFVETKRMVLVK
jgi:photosystem II stability/assembly factor-like uncharacterized protein